jgi:DNA-binding CsgD family transcriptional regulator
MILIGLVMSDYPGKQNLERRIISIKTVRRGINWLRKKSGVKKIEFK